MAFAKHGRIDADSTGATLKDYKISDLDGVGAPSTTNPHYFGYVDTNCQWYIMKLTDTQARYAKGDSDYDENWENRANLTYYNFQNIF